MIVQAQSGSPVNIVTSNSALNGIANTVRPDVTGPITTIGDRATMVRHGAFRSREPFRQPRPETPSIGPRFDNTDLSIAKMTPVHGTRVELRVDVFNLFNHPNFGQPGNIVGSRNFGVITSTRFPTGELGSSRQIQCSARITF